MTDIVKPWLDKILGKTISKKLMVYLIACVFLLVGTITQELWWNATMVYLFVQGTVDALKVFKNEKTSSTFSPSPGHGTK